MEVHIEQSGAGKWQLNDHSLGQSNLCRALAFRFFLLTTAFYLFSNLRKFSQRLFKSGEVNVILRTRKSRIWQMVATYGDWERRRLVMMESVSWYKSCVIVKSDLLAIVASIQGLRGIL